MFFRVCVVGVANVPQDKFGPLWESRCNLGGAWATRPNESHSHVVEQRPGSGETRRRKSTSAKNNNKCVMKLSS